MKLAKPSAQRMYQTVRESEWALIFGLCSGLYVLVVWLATMGHNETIDPSFIVLMVTVLIGGFGAYFRRFGSKELFPTQTISCFATLGAQCGALLLPKLLFPHTVFPSHGEMTLTFLRVIPGLWPYLLTLACVGGAALGALGVSALLDHFGEDVHSTPNPNDNFRPLTPFNLIGEILFDYIVFVPLTYLLLVSADSTNYGTVSRMQLFPVALGIFILFFEALTVFGLSFYAIFGNNPSERSWKFVYFLCLGAAFLGAELMWRQCGSFDILQKLDQHRVTLTPWTERIVFFELSFEGVVGACALSCLVGFLTAKVSNLFQ